MLSVKSNHIYLTRGDTAFIELSLFDQDGNPYIPEQSDRIYFRLKQTLTSKSIILEKLLDVETVEEGTSSITNILLTFQEDDTKDLKFMTYKYEVEVVTGTNYHFTVIENADFEIGPELEIRS